MSVDARASTPSDLTFSPPAVITSSSAMFASVRVALLSCALVSCFSDATGDDDSTAAASMSGDDSGTATTATAPVCGNGVLEPGEGCDAGAGNAIGAACKPDCVPNSCGDGVLGPGEACDDGNDRDDDACNNLCFSNCGDGVVNAGEACDDGNPIEDDDCTTRCAPPTCGDGIVQAKFAEECDDGPDNNYSAACTGYCKDARCGDGFVGPTEQCDPGDNVEAPDCDFDCRHPRCGDGKINEAALEDCEGVGPFDNGLCLVCHFACDAGFGDCADDDVDDKGNDLGCETDTRTSTAHCGGCNNPCPEGQACTDSVCG